MPFNTALNVKLSEFERIFTDIVRDGAFYSIGKIPTRLPGRVVPVGAEKYLAEIQDAPNGLVGVICTPALASAIPESLACAVAENPMVAAMAVHTQLTERADQFWTTFPSRIAEGAQIHETAYIAPKNVVIGKNAVIGPNATIMERAIIGDHFSLGANSVVGSDAYEVRTVDGVPKILPQAGGVKIGDSVSILSGTTVARSIFPLFTEIGDACTFDNLVHVAHDCILGKRVKMAATAMLCGRVMLKDDVFIAPNATISNGVTIGERGFVTLGAVVVEDVPEGGRVTGNFAVDHAQFTKLRTRDSAF